VATFFVGWQIKQSGQDFQISQSTYAQKKLDAFGMTDAKAISTPIDYNVKLTPATAEESPEDFPYAQLVGALLWLAMGTRPDLAFSVNFLARFQSKPQKRHWLAAK
jgi:hypothetical protein